MIDGSGSPPDALLPPLTRRSLLTGAGGAALAAPAIVKAQGLSKGRIAVIGAGVFGTWTAEHLRRAGHRVTLVDAVGPAHARMTLYSGERIDAAEAQRIGLVNRTVPVEQLDEVVAKLDEARFRALEPVPKDRCPVR